MPLPSFNIMDLVSRAFGGSTPSPTPTPTPTPFPTTIPTPVPPGAKPIQAGDSGPPVYRVPPPTPTPSPPYAQHLAEFLKSAQPTK